jgi:hypothetical protein
MTSGAIAFRCLGLIALLASARAQAGAIDPAPERRLCTTRPALMVALGRASNQARAVPVRQRLTLQLSPEKSVVLPGSSADLEQQRAEARGATYGGVVRLEAARAGTYRVGVDRDAWLDIATATGKLLDPVPDEGTFDCDGPQKVLLYTLPAPGTYWLQIALSPRREILLTVIPVD